MAMPSVHVESLGDGCQGFFNGLNPDSATPTVPPLPYRVARPCSLRDWAAVPSWISSSASVPLTEGVALGRVGASVVLLPSGVAVGVVVAAGRGLVAGVAGAEVLRVPRRP